MINLAQYESTHQEEDNSTEVHEGLHRRLVEWIVDRIRVLVVALVTDPRLAGSSGTSSRASFAHELELKNGKYLPYK